MVTRYHCGKSYISLSERERDDLPGPRSLLSLGNLVVNQRVRLSKCFMTLALKIKPWQTV
jgi:hypothetical protein